MTDDDFDNSTAMWGVPLDETTAPAATLPFPEHLAPVDADIDTFLLRGEDPPSDGIYRPRLRGFGDAA